MKPKNNNANKTAVEDAINTPHFCCDAECIGWDTMFVQHGLGCGYEYCIESQPLSEKETDADCPIFGHQCPGDKKFADICRNAMMD